MSEGNRIGARRVARGILLGTSLLLAFSGCGGGGGSSAPPQTYTLSGTVSGLNSSGLVLSVNSSPVSINSGATSVALASGLASGTAYTVSVKTGPAGETCSVTHGTGTIASANVTNVVVSCTTNT